MDFGIKDIPVLGDAWKAVSGDPESVKAAYDKIMAQSMAMGEQNKNFIMGQQGKAQQYYAPINHMFQSMYGTEGIQAPMTPGVPGSQPLQQPAMQAPQQPGTINQMMGQAPSMGKASAFRGGR